MLVACGVLVLLFGLYLLFGTGLPASQSQTTLRHQLNSELADPAPSPRPGGISPANPAPVIQAPAVGNAVGVIDIPSINLDKVMVQGIGESDLQKGPGHYPGTPLPGERGNVAIAGHRTTYGAPFYRLNELQKGQSIQVITVQGSFTYHVLRSIVVSPTDTAVIAPSTANLLTLTTCTPRYSAAQRLIVQAVLVGNPLPDSPVLASAVKGAPVHHRWLPALLWGLALVAFGTIVWGLRRRIGRRGWLAYLGGTPVVLVGLYFFFASVSTLLPVTI